MGLLGETARRRLRIAAKLFAMMAAVLFVSVLLVRWRHVHMWRAERAALAAAGFPVTLAEVEALYPPIPEVENGAPLFLAAAAALPRIGDDLDGRLPIAGNGLYPETSRAPYPEASIAAMREYLALSRESLDLLHEGARRPKVRFDFELSNGYDSRSYSISSSLSYLARLSEIAMAVAAHDGDGDRFVAEARAGIALPRALYAMPDSVFHVRAVSLTAWVASEFDRAMALGAFEDRHLRALEEILRGIPDYRSVLPALGAELYLFLNLAQEPGAAWESGAETGESLASQYAPRRIAFDVELVAKPVMGWLYQTLLMTHGETAANVTVGRAWMESFDGFPAGAETYVNDRIKFDTFFANLYTMGASVFSLGFGPMYYAKGTASRDVLIARLQIERYRLKHGVWPDRLEDLVPEFAGAVPTDVFDGTPLIYRRKGNGFLLYSFGMDRIDDGGESDRSVSGDIAMNVLDDGVEGADAIP